MPRKILRVKVLMHVKSDVTQNPHVDVVLKEGWENVEDDKRSGRPQTSRTVENIEKVSATVCKNRLQTITESVGISSTTCQWILTKDLNMHWMCQYIVPSMLNEDSSADLVKSASLAELKDMAKNGFQKCFDNFYKPWQKCVVTQGSYFEEECVSEV
ncbi:hypothetical protein TNCV_3494481 [Trichonephila clavipes]|nr:hypothetical protein TNCV_3494481 [Trichonephila clavipes]